MISERLSARDPTNIQWLRDLSISHDRVGDVAEAEGNLAAARSSYEASLAIAERLSAQDPTSAELLRDLSVSGHVLGGLLLRQGHHREALHRLRAAVATHRQAVERAPHLSEEHHLWETRLRDAELLSGGRKLEVAGAHLELAYVRHTCRDWAGSAKAFETALSEEALRADLDLGNLYNAACSAALAVAEGQAKWQSRALEWLGEDLRRRLRALEEIQTKRASDVTEEEAERLDAAEAAIREHIGWARTGDPDLEALRGTPEFDELFKGCPRSGLRKRARSRPTGSDPHQ